MNPQGGEQVAWHIYPQEYEIAQNMLRHKSVEEAISILNEKGTKKWENKDFLLAPIPNEKQISPPLSDSSTLLQGHKSSLRSWTYGREYADS